MQKAKIVNEVSKRRIPKTETLTDGSQIVLKKQKTRPKTRNA